MSERIVDDFESIEIEEQHGEAGFGMSSRRLERAAQSIHEERAIGKLGERVVKRVVHQAFDRHLAIGDVGLRSGDAGGRDTEMSPT